MSKETRLAPYRLEIVNSLPQNRETGDVVGGVKTTFNVALGRILGFTRSTLNENQRHLNELESLERSMAGFIAQFRIER